MAERRMFTKKVTDDDNFMALSSSAQALYLHLSMSADDDGFCNQVSISMFKAHASIQDLQALLEKRYIYQFDNGVIVIKHWRMANALRKDRYTPTAFQEELSHLDIKDNGAYTWLPDGCQVVADGLPQYRIGKDSIDKESIGEESIGEVVEIPNEEKKDKKKRKEAKPSVYFPDEALNQTFLDYIAMRKLIKKPMSDRAIELAIKDLQKLAAIPFSDSMDNDLAIQILEQSIKNSWLGLFPLKQEKRETTTTDFIDKWRDA